MKNINKFYIKSIPQHTNKVFFSVILCIALFFSKSIVEARNFSDHILIITIPDTLKVYNLKDTDNTQSNNLKVIHRAIDFRDQSSLVITRDIFQREFTYDEMQNLKDKLAETYMKNGINIDYTSVINTNKGHRGFMLTGSVRNIQTNDISYFTMGTFFMHGYKYKVNYVQKNNTLRNSEFIQSLYTTSCVAE